MEFDTLTPTERFIAEQVVLLARTIKAADKPLNASPKIKSMKSKWQQKCSACESFRNAKGEKKFTTYATSVNTKEDGWRIMYVALFSKMFSSFLTGRRKRRSYCTKTAVQT